MILISQTAFLNHKISISNNMVLRVNCAWIKTKEELWEMLGRLSSFNVFLDLPTGRRKPPIPVLDIHQISPILYDNNFKNVKYFGVTDAISKHSICSIRQLLPNRIAIVPKIESLLGIFNIDEICRSMKNEEKYLMLDKEDLYTGVDGKICLYENLIKKLREGIVRNDKKLLELQGVIFAESVK